MLRRLESLSPSAASVCVICVCCVCPAQDTYVLQTNKRGVKCQEEVNLNFRKRLKKIQRDYNVGWSA